MMNDNFTYYLIGIICKSKNSAHVIEITDLSYAI